MSALFGMIFGGGATGLIGTVFSRIFNFAERAAERRFIIEKYRLDAEIRAQEHESEERIAEATAAAGTLEASYEHDSSLGRGAPWVINILRLVRPTITLLLWILVGLIWFSLMREITSETLPWAQEKTLLMKEQIVGSILYAATAATLWWFGTRDMRK